MRAPGSSPDPATLDALVRVWPVLFALVMMMLGGLAIAYNGGSQVSEIRADVQAVRVEIQRVAERNGQDRATAIDRFSRADEQHSQAIISLQAAYSQTAADRGEVRAMLSAIKEEQGALRRLIEQLMGERRRAEGMGLPGPL